MKRTRKSSCPTFETRKAFVVAMRDWPTLYLRYTYAVTWVPEQKEYVGLCTEFKSLSWFDKYPSAALSGIHRVVSEVLDDMLQRDELPPMPIEPVKPRKQ